MTSTIGTQLRGIMQHQQYHVLGEYWKQLLPASRKAGALTPKAASELFEIARSIGKSPSDIENDLALLLELDSLEDAPANLAKAEKGERSALDTCAAKQEQAKQLDQQAAQLRREADAARDHAAAVKAGALLATGRLADLRRRLVSARHPESLTAQANDKRAFHVDNLKNELRVIDLQLTGATQKQIDQLPELRRHQLRRPEIVAQLKQFDVGVPPMPEIADPSDPVLEQSRNDETDRGSRVTIYQSYEDDDE